MRISPNLQLKCISFRGQKVKGQGHSETTRGPISTLGGVFYLSPGYIDIF